jgi:hypothetical protein
MINVHTCIFSSESLEIRVSTLRSCFLTQPPMKGLGCLGETADSKTGERIYKMMLEYF